MKTKTTHCLRGHERTPENLSKSRNCKACMAELTAKWYVNNREEVLAKNAARQALPENKKRKVELNKVYRAVSETKIRYAKQEAIYRAFPENKIKKAKSNAAWTKIVGPLGYFSWCSMVARCTNPESTNYSRYGGANPPITVSPEWMTWDGFLSSAGPKPGPEFSLSRFGDEGGYGPGLCVWGDPLHQKLQRAIKSRSHPSHPQPSTRT